MKLGVMLGYWGSRPDPATQALVLDAERLGYDSVWTAEAYGSDALTPLAWYGARTKRIRLGSAVMQMAARAPAATAMAALTLDHLSGGRFVLGLGVSGPQVVEGWYGQPFAQPLARTREYVGIVRRILARDEPVRNEGPHYPLPYPGGTGLGKPLRSTVHPLRRDLPIFLGAEGPKNIALTAEIADGWLAAFYSPWDDAGQRAALAEGFSRPGARHDPADFEVAAMISVVVDDDIERACDRLRPGLALYIGGMGSRDTNFHFNVIARLGFEEACVEVQRLYLDGRRKDAAAAVPTALVERLNLVGPPSKIREEIAQWERSPVTTLLVRADPQSLKLVPDLMS
ncbi:MAG TPA: LLM class F420-dependent oxidoreductase [Candidatus Dormibacteraeota bacterium]|jgi:F420-dependent oxidoreductase-like protein|nr:LLM class F420-dependent oxidoreductase [Candidatus Dormibacteraeota bacterium]